MKFKHFLPHLVELRRRLIYALIMISVLFALFLYCSQTLFDLIAKPIFQQSGQATLIATHVTTPFTTPLKLAFFTTLLCASPFLLYQFWAFIAPGLYTKEKQQVRLLFFFSYCLFCIGAAFAYFIVCPMALHFFQSITPQSVTVMTDMHYYLDFVLALTLSFGLCFQVPLLTFALLKANLFSVAQIKRKRPLIIVLAFTFGMVLTPPDVISQIMLAIPIWGLFELGLLAYQWHARATLKSLPSSQSH